VHGNDDRSDALVGFILLENLLNPSNLVLSNCSGEALSRVTARPPGAPTLTDDFRRYKL